MISDPKTSLAALCGLWLAGLSAADTVTLGGGNSRLSGEVRSIDGDGHVELTSGLASEPLRLKSDMVDRIEFTRQATTGTLLRSQGVVAPLASVPLEESSSRIRLPGFN